MNPNENFKLENVLGKSSKSNTFNQDQTPNLINLDFGSSDPFNKTRSRLSNSPLKTPLQCAITKVVANINKDPSSSRVSAGYSNQVSARNIQTQEEQEDDQPVLDRLHPEALQFLQKYFSGCSTKSITIHSFIDKLLQEFSALWADSQAKAVLPQFVNKLSLKLGYDTVQLWKLEQLVRQNGIVGLILSIFKELKADQEQGNISRTESQYYSSKYTPQSEWGSSVNSPPEITNVKNIIQQFTEGIAKTTENEIYAKLNNQMRRLVLKYNETQNLLKLVNDKVNDNIDKINYGTKKNQLQKNYERAIARLNERTKFLQNELEKQKIEKALISAENTKLNNENRRLNEVIDKLQNHIIKTHEGQSYPKPQSRLVIVPQANGKADDKSRIITYVPSVHPSFSRIVPVSPIRTQSQVPNLTRISQIKGQKQNNGMLNTATIVRRDVTPTKQRVATYAPVSPSRAQRIN